MARRLALFLLVVVALPACGSSGPKLPSSNGLQLVLQPTDLPRGFQLFDKGPLAQADIQPGSRADRSRFGHKGGWKTRYHRGGSPATRGPLVVVSFVDLFGSADGAKKDLGAYRAQFKSQGANSLPAPKLGDEALAARASGALQAVDYYIAWRYRNATASVAAEGFKGKLTLDEVVAIARKQQRRLAAAAKK